MKAEEVTALAAAEIQGWFASRQPSTAPDIAGRITQRLIAAGVPIEVTPEIACLCGDAFGSTEDMAQHLWMAHGHEVPPAVSSDRAREALVRLSRFAEAVMAAAPSADYKMSFNDLRFADTVQGKSIANQFGDETDPWPDDTAARLAAVPTTPSDESSVAPDWAPTTEAGRHLLLRLRHEVRNFNSSIGRGWDVEEAVQSVEDEARASVGLDAYAVRTSDSHPQAVDVASILFALAQRKRRFRGLWVQWHGDGTDRAAKDQVVVSVQYDSYGHVESADITGPNVRDASRALAAHLSDGDIEVPA